MACEHLNFRATANIGRLSKTEGGPVTGYTCRLEVKCADCGLPFRFVGMRAGSSPVEPRTSIDGLELRAPIEPAIHEKFAAEASYTMPPKANN